MTVLTLQVTGKLEVYAYFIFFVSWTYVCSYMRLIKRSFFCCSYFLSHLFVVFFKCTLLQIKLHFWEEKIISVSSVSHFLMLLSTSQSIECQPLFLF